MLTFQQERLLPCQSLLSRSKLQMWLRRLPLDLGEGFFFSVGIRFVTRCYFLVFVFFCTCTCAHFPWLHFSIYEDIGEYVFDPKAPTGASKLDSGKAVYFEDSALELKQEVTSHTCTLFCLLCVPIAKDVAFSLLTVRLLHFLFSLPSSLASFHCLCLSPLLSFPPSLPLLPSLSSSPSLSLFLSLPPPQSNLLESRR